tara:strand:+ start:16 stop:255 length:240 start_codon:yes stop_codon:yes gene_type:complete
MWSFIKWAVGVRPEKQSLTHNSMGKLPESTFINYARDKADVDDDKETHKNIYEFRAWERSVKQNKQLKDYQDWYDYFNH